MKPVPFKCRRAENPEAVLIAGGQTLMPLLARALPWIGYPPTRHDWLLNRQCRSGGDARRPHHLRHDRPRRRGAALGADLYFLKVRKPETRNFDLKLCEHWRDVVGALQIPYLGFAAHRGWVAHNAALTPRIEAAYRDAAVWLSANPEAAAQDTVARAYADTAWFGRQRGWARRLKSVASCAGVPRPRRWI